MVRCRQHVGRLSMVCRSSKSFSQQYPSSDGGSSCLIHRELASARSTELFLRLPARAKDALNRVVQRLFVTPEREK